MTNELMNKVHVCTLEDKTRLEMHRQSDDMDKVCNTQKKGEQHTDKPDKKE